MSLFLLSLIFGIAGGTLRALELRNAFGDIDAVGRMPEPWHVLTIAMISLSVVFVALAWVFSRRESKLIPQIFPRLLRLLAGLVLTTTAGYELYLAITITPRAEWSQLLYALLFLLAGLAVLMASVNALRCKEFQYSLAYLIPVFWSCFRLMNAFFQHAANPIANSYIYSLFSDIALALTLLFFAGCYFANRRGKTLRFAGGLACFFGIVSFLSPLLYRMQNTALSTLPHVGFSRTYPFNREAMLVDLGVFAFTALFGAAALLTDGKISMTAAEELPSENIYPGVPPITSDPPSSAEFIVENTSPRPPQSTTLSTNDTQHDDISMPMAPREPEQHVEEDISMDDINAMLTRLGIDTTEEE
ncbi:MAG: hypothetical protein FWE06_02295 [Oscillospiraceae bacterium]|nr:hypothetical protein [Oscillospiraceae bacterium]